MLTPPPRVCNPGGPSPPADGAPPHGVPDAQAGFLEELLAEARRLRDLGRPAGDVRRAVLQLNQNLPRPLPPFSAGGLADCLDALLAEGPGGRG
ncbi:MAG TPA: hypothetical protein VKA46_29585 [Gemmataceae bacterium]|nr:hypothetical protein [Gemmataceae bacterium]